MTVRHNLLPLVKWLSTSVIDEMLGTKLFRRDSAVKTVQQSTGISAQQATEQAQNRGASAHVLDAAELMTKRTTLDGIAAVLSFPEWAGRNLDALYDCLTDLSWLPEGEHVLIWCGHQNLAEQDPKTYRGINSVLRDAAENSMCGRAFSAVLTCD